MWEEILKAFSLVYLPSTLKFIFGPIGGKAAGLHLITTMVATMTGMMTVVILFTYFGEFIRKKLTLIFNRKEKTEQKKEVNHKRYVQVFRRYGLAGIAFLTPVILTPIGGTLLAVSFTTNREKILLFMFISACAWSAVLTLAVYFGYDAVMRFIDQIQPV
jgi:membrane protein DedA with SNARE-associated domain